MFLAFSCCIFLLFSISLGHDVIFEGPEKRLEVHFKPLPNYTEGVTLRDIQRVTWDRILEIARCQIISTTSNDYFDSHLLSESSLFVYPTKVIIKTCGTTRLLQALPKILEEAGAKGFEASSVLFSRKNYFRPQLQHFPHKNFEDEAAFLRDLFHGGHEDVLGPVDGDHYCIYTYDKEDVKKYEPLIELMMSSLEPTIMNLYCKESSPFHASIVPLPHETCQENITKILELVEGARNDDYFFEPCGYSLNGMKDQSYYTIHVSPQHTDSYASFESTVFTEKLLSHILDIFRPARFSFTFFAEDDSDPLDEPPHSFKGFHLEHKTTMNYGFENSKKLVFQNFKRK